MADLHVKNDIVDFENQCREEISRMVDNAELRQAGLDFSSVLAPYNYVYHFKWLGLPIIQLPQDIVAMQEIIWQVKPDVIIETGIARGGSVIFYASMLELIGRGGKVIGIDIDIREHNRRAIEAHPMSKNIYLVEGSSTDISTLAKVQELIDDIQPKATMVLLDSNHTHEHVLCELEMYQKFVSVDSYLVVFDTTTEDLYRMPSQPTADSLNNRPWGVGNNPKTAVIEFLKDNDRFVIDKEIGDGKLVITGNLSGYLRCCK